MCICIKCSNFAPDFGVLSQNRKKVHELPFAKSIFKVVEKTAEENGAKRVCQVSLEVGVLRDFIPDLVQKYWDYITRGTIADGSTIKITTIEATAQCRECSVVYPIDTRHINESKCPACGCDMGTLLTGRELRIMNIEII